MPPSFPAVQRGRVLLFAAEDSASVVRQRLAGIVAATGVVLEALDIHVIVAPVVRLDVEFDQRRLEDTMSALRPVLLVLDPLATGATSSATAFSEIDVGHADGGDGSDAIARGGSHSEHAALGRMTECDCATVSSRRSRP